MSFTEIDSFVTEEERLYFISRIDESDWYQHKSSVSGKKSPLQFKSIEYRGVQALLMKMDPNTTQDWHTDGGEKRNTLILHPLTNHYAPFVSGAGESSKPIIADTQSKHAVFNNGNVRLNLQIAFPNHYKDVHEDKNSVLWKTLDRFYKGNKS